MKRILAFLLVLYLAFTLCACATNAPAETTDTSVPTAVSEPEEETTIPTETAEPTEPIVLPHWEITQMVDDFGDPVGEKVASATFSGSFSNTATTDSELKVVAFWGNPNPATEHTNRCEGYFAFRLLEYGDTPATYSTNDNPIIKIKIGDGIYEESLSGSAPNGELYLFHSTKSLDVYTNIRAQMEQGAELRCIIEIGSSKYTFTLTADGYVDAYNEVLAVSE